VAGLLDSRDGQTPILDVSHFHPNTGDYYTHPKVDDYCSFLYIVRNLCNNHPKLDVSFLPKLDDIKILLISNIGYFVSSKIG